MTLQQWKNVINKCILCRDEQRIKVNVRLYKLLSYFEIIDTGIFGWWVFAFKNPCDARKVTTVMRLLLNIDRHGTKLCKKCATITYDSYEHIFFDCQVAEQLRPYLWNRFIAKFLAQMILEIHNMNKNRKVKFI